MTRSTGTSLRAFVVHLVQMLLVMVAGMAVLSVAADAVLAVAGTSMEAQPEWLRLALMGVAMTAPMVVWMAVRGHNRARCVEMAAAMIVPTALAAGLAAAGVLSGMAAMIWLHVVMIPVMVVVMLWRYAQYARPHAGHGD